MAYASDESGRPEIYVQTFPESGGKWQISTNGGVTPAWRADGKELYYIAPDGKLMAVAVKTAATLEAGAPTALFETRVAAAFNMFNKLNYAVSADGKRFLLANLSQGAQSRPIRIVANWIAALKK